MTNENDKFAMQSWPLRRYEFPMPIRYHLSAPTAVKGVVVCLHGYQDHALSMLRRIGWWDAVLPFQILAINGPFPVPLWLNDGFKEAYSWYFRDTSRDLEFVSPAATALNLSQLMTDLNLKDTPKVLFGFSQGGYLCPYLSQQLNAVRGIIGLGCGYPEEAYALNKPLKVYALHGSSDERVLPEPARLDFERILTVGHRGEFHLIPGLTHRVEASVEPLVRRLALECLT
jgi:predicted esterase